MTTPRVLGLGPVTVRHLDTDSVRANHTCLCAHPRKAHRMRMVNTIGDHFGIQDSACTVKQCGCIRFRRRLRPAWFSFRWMQ